MGKLNAVRAAVLANGKNLFPIVMPYHYPVSRDNLITNYSGGLSTKKLLLTHEGVPVHERVQQLSLF